MHKNHVGVGERQSIGAYLILVYQLLVFPMIGQLLQVTLTLGFICAESNKHFEHMKPSFTAPFDVLTFDILTQEMVTGSGFGSWWIEVLEKMLTGYLLLSSSRFLLILYFTACSFFSLVCTDREPGTGYLYSKYRTKNSPFLHIFEFGT